MIYFIQEQDRWLIKIGFTNGDPLDRLASLQTGSAAKLELVAAFDGTFDEEKMLHRVLADARVIGEWFKPVPKLLTIMMRMAGAEAISEHKEQWPIELQCDQCLTTFLTYKTDLNSDILCPFHAEMAACEKGEAVFS